MARSRGSGRKTDYTWSGNTFSQDAQGTAVTINALTTINQAGTIVRNRGELLVSIDGPVDGDKAVAAFGLIIASDSQVAAGATAFPSPATDLDANWLWHSFATMLVQAAGDDGTISTRLMIDSKAMRKVKQNDQLVLVADMVRESGTPTVDYAGGIRSLLGT